MRAFWKRRPAAEPVSLLDRVFPPDQCDDGSPWSPDWLGMAGHQGRRGGSGQEWVASWVNAIHSPNLHLISEYVTWGPGADDEAIAQWRKEEGHR
jgi:hypothetical protein